METGLKMLVIRKWKGKKHSQYAPEEGNRYDGIYKMVRYWPGLDHLVTVVPSEDIYKLIGSRV